MAFLSFLFRTSLFVCFFLPLVLLLFCFVLFHEQFLFRSIISKKDVDILNEATCDYAETL